MNNFSNQDFKHTSLWMSAFCNSTDDENVNRLKSEYLNLRSKVKPILENISKDFPQLTKHDITHVDSLWSVGSKITGEGYPINPLEGFILGCSFLIHDIALSYDIYGGKDKLRLKSEWSDYRHLHENTTDEEIDFITVRALHAEKCKELLISVYPGTSQYLIEDSELRKYYAELIGKIASSHHWEIAEVEKKFTKQIGPLAGFPPQWSINPKKIACIVRCADAAHIDNGRAPFHMLELLKTNKISQQHWIGQSYLSQIIVNPDNPSQIIFTSSASFKEEDFGAWNVVYEAIKVCNKEIINSNAILGENKFKVRSVSGAESKASLNKYIPTDGWLPFEAEVKTDDVLGLISDMGGTHLYGQQDKLIIVLRELIQNSRDAVIARRILEKSDDYGKIKICYSQKDRTLIVSDNGVGMSLNVIKKSLLNFHKSLWHSSDVIYEFPHLLSNNFESIGKYGIGFFSVFMIAKQVIITTKRYDLGLDSTCTIKFLDGITTSPIVSFGRKPDFNSQISTEIKLVIQDDIEVDPYPIRISLEEDTPMNISLKNVIPSICPGLDVDVYYNDSLVHENINSPHFDKKKWLRGISYAEDRNDKTLDNYIENNYNHLEFIKDESGKTTGLAAINQSIHSVPSSLSYFTINGLLSNMNSRSHPSFFGMLDVQCSNCSRNEYNGLHVSQEQLRIWIDSQLKYLDKNNPSNYCGFTSSAMDFKYDTRQFGHVIAFYDEGRKILPISFIEIINRLKKGGHLKIILLQSLNKDSYGNAWGYIDFQENPRQDLLKTPQDVVIIQHPLYYNRPINSMFRSVFLDKNFRPVFEWSLLECIFNLANDYGINLNIVVESIQNHQCLIIKECNQT